MSLSDPYPNEQMPVAVVTGAASGIGFAVAEELLRRGAVVVIVDRDSSRVIEAARHLGCADRVTTICADMSEEADVEALFEQVRQEHQQVDVLVNNAGVQISGPIIDFSEADWDLLLGINPKSCFLAAKHATPLMASGGGGAIVNIASIAGIRGGPGQTAYSASKGAIIAFSRALANELAPLKIRVNCLAPGWVDTPFNEPAIENMGGRQSFDSMIFTTVPLKRQGSTAEIAKAVTFLSLPDSSFMTGQTLVVDGGQI